MTGETGKKKGRGAGRVAFIAHLDVIKNELEKGHTALSIYEQLSDKLAHILSYSMFVKYVRVLRKQGVSDVLRAGFVPRRSYKAGEQGQPKQAFAPERPAPEKRLNASKPSVGTPDSTAGVIPRRPFTYDGNPRADDKERLIWGTKPLFPEDLNHNIPITRPRKGKRSWLI